MKPRLPSLAVSLLVVLALLPATVGSANAAPASTPAPALVPQPSSEHALPGQSVSLDRSSRILVPLGSHDAVSAANYLAQVLRPSTGFALPVTIGFPRRDDITFDLWGAASLGNEGYTLDVTRGGVRISAHASAGLFYGVQTLRQLLPAGVEKRSKQVGPWTIGGVRISDTPRFAWRGAMLDVARHFFDVGQVETYLDELSMYKINVLHLHLSDNDGWRIDINGWPRLARYGGSTDASRGPGGFYTQAQYGEIVKFAAARHITIVPEIDAPGHVTAAQASYAQLNCDGVAPPLLNPGYSSLCVRSEVTYQFLDDVIGQLAAMTPGKYLHIGGDEALTTSAADYTYFVDRLQAIVHAHGKELIGWHQIEAADLTSGPVAQYWGTAGSADDVALAQQAKARGNKIVMSPADKSYLDMKYDAQTPIGQDWAGYNSVSDAYDWDPATFVPGIGESDIDGVEAPLWTDVFPTISDVDYMTFPRLPGIAEIGWSPESTHTWTGYRTRLAAQAPRWDALGLTYYRSPEVPWPAAA
jgi:hexosaminidase